MPSALTLLDAYEPLARSEVRAGLIWLALYDLVKDDRRVALDAALGRTEAGAR